MILRDLAHSDVVVKELAIEIECGPLTTSTTSTPQTDTTITTNDTIPTTTPPTTIMTTPYSTVPWSTSALFYEPCAYVTEGGAARLSCGLGTISNITFASYGLPIGDCYTGFTADPECNAADSLSVVEGICVGLQGCTIDAINVRSVFAAGISLCVYAPVVLSSKVASLLL